MSSSPSETVEYVNGRPTFAGSVTKCFKDSGNGLLFWINNEAKGIWAFYNDTVKYSMIVKVTFGKDSEIEPLGKTVMERDAETGEYKCEIAICPTTTEMFIKGIPNGFKMCIEANPNIIVR